MNVELEVAGIRYGNDDQGNRIGVVDFHPVSLPMSVSELRKFFSEDKYIYQATIKQDSIEEADKPLKKDKKTID